MSARSRIFNPRFLGFALLFFLGRLMLRDTLRASANLGYVVTTDLVFFLIAVAIFHAYAFCW